MLVVGLVLVLLPGVAVALYTRPFRPTRALLPLRALVAAGAAGAGVMLGLSLTYDWWIVDDSERERILITDAGSPFVVVVVVVGLVAAAATVLAAWGRRNWAPLALIVAWLLIGIAWYAATGETVDSDASGEPRPGIRLATWAVLLATGTTVVGSIGRLAEARARAGRSTERPSGPPGVPSPARMGPPSAVLSDAPSDAPPDARVTRTARRMSGWDVVALTALALVVIGTTINGTPGLVVAVLAIALLGMAIVRRPAGPPTEYPRPDGD